MKKKLYDFKIIKKNYNLKVRNDATTFNSKVIIFVITYLKKSNNSKSTPN